MKKSKIVSIIAGVVIFAAIAICLVVMTPKNKEEGKNSNASKPVAETTTKRKTSTGSASVVYTVKADNADEALLKDVAATLEERLMCYYIIDFETKIDASQKQISIDFAWEDADADFNPDYVAAEISKENAFEIAPEDTSSDSAMKKGEAVITNEDVASAEYVVYSKDNTYEVLVKLTDEGKKKLKAADDKNLYAWINGKAIGPRSSEESGSPEDFLIGYKYNDPNDAFELVNKISYGPLEVKVEIESFKKSK